MGEAWANTAEVEGAAEEGGGRPKEVTQSVVVDCLALDLLLNKPSALECVVVPWLRTCLESMLSKTTTYSRPAMNSSARNHRSGGGAAAAAEAAAPDNPLLSAAVEEEEEDAGGLDEGGAAANNGVLCAIIGLGSVAASLLPTLLRLFFWLPFPSPQSICDVRLVGLAIRTAGGAKGLEAMTCVVQQQAEKPHLLAAAAYALSAYSFELVGHTSALCVPPGAMRRRSGAKKGNTSLFQLVTDDLPASLAASPTMEELRPLWSNDDPLLLFPTATTSAPTGPHLCLQSSPPYRPTHLMIDAEVARCELMAHLSSNQFRACHAHPHVMVLLHDALSARLLGDVVTPAAQRLYSPILSQLRRDLHRVLADDIASIAPQEQSLLRLPTLPYSLRFFAGDQDTLFAVESALLHALLARPAAALVQEQALMSLCALPPEARAHVVQPVTNFFIELTHTMHWRQTATMRRSVVQTADSSGHPVLGPGSCIGTGEVNSDEAVVAAAAIAAGTVCMNPFAPSSCVDSCVVALVPVFQKLVHSPLWRLRHAACVGLARIGPLAPNPSSIIDFFVNCLALRAPLLTEERSSSQPPSAAAERSPQLPLLQSATVVWCLAQQQQGGVRALLRLLQDPQQPLEVHHWCAFLLAEVDVHKACGKLGGCKSLDADALLDEMVQVLGRLIVMQGALEENTVLLCVRALAGVVHRCYTNATSPTGTTESATDAVLVLDTPKSVQEAVDYYQEEQPNACFTVLTSVLETALLPTNVLKALCLYLCRYCGCHGELYVSEMLLQSRSVASRTAAAFGLRACGAKVLRSVVLGMNDDSYDVRREAFETLTVIGASAALEVLRQRPAEQRYQVRAALRDCLLLDAGRPVRRQVAELLYHALLTEEPLVAR
ncbi:hypothetical protein JKF63_03681 [Porcisia hertigi]|uniref:Uncharacterized protein n=1 Tax=Porcisia hertigi TaxID=2761500 RepID=A0A836L6E1_9TRYP|nr:hypothetical protein JKF63_03681 [Porcisia hertigi]